MNKILLTTIILSFGICLMAQTKGKRKITTTPKTTLPIKGGEDRIPAGSNLDKPVLADFALSKCERHLKYHKIMWKLLLNANPSDSNPLQLSSEISRMRFVPVNSASGHIVFDKSFNTIDVPAITDLNQPFGSNVFPISVTGTTVLHTLNNGSFSSLGFHWKSGNYCIIKEVKDIYKVGTSNFIDVENTQGVSHTIRIFPAYLMDGCQLAQR